MAGLPTNIDFMRDELGVLYYLTPRGERINVALYKQGEFPVIGQADSVTGGISISAPDQRPLYRWRRKLAFDAANAKLALLGDSTSDESTSAVSIYNALRNLHTRHGEALEGVTGDSSHILSFGYSGMALSVWLADTVRQAALWAAAPDLIVFSFGINDIRLGQNTPAQLNTLIDSAITLIKHNLPSADILLRVPNTLLTTNVGSLNYVQDSGGTINPAGLAQTYSTQLRDTYLSFVGKYANVDVWDVQTEVFGTLSRSTHPLMADQLHPTTQASSAGGVPTGGGYVAIAAALAKRIGRENASFVAKQDQYRILREGLFSTSAGNGYIDLSAIDGTGEPAAQFPLSTSDLLFVEGVASPVSLSGATIYRPFGGTSMRIALGGTDFTSCVGKRVSIAANHPDRTTGDRQVVSVDLPSIAAGATSNTAVTVTGARSGDLHDATAVLCSPPAAFHSAGLRLLNCYPSANDTVQVIVNNPTGGAVDLASASFAFWVVR